MIYINGKEVKPYVGDYKPLTVYKGTEKLAGWVENTISGIENIQIKNGYSTMKVKPFGKSEQVQTEQSANLCPNVDSDKWVLSGGAYKENGYIVLPQVGAKAEMVVEWNGQNPSGNGNYVCYWGANFVTEDVENGKYLIETIYLNEDKEIITSNGNASLIGGTDIWKNFYFVYSPDTIYGQGIRDAKYIRYRITFGSSNTVPYKFKDPMISKTSCATYVEFVPDSPSPNYRSEIENVSGDLKVKVDGKNLLPSDLEKYTYNNGTYGFLKISEQRKKLIMSLAERNASINISGVYLGFTENGINPDKGYMWLIGNGSVNTNNIYNEQGSRKQMMYVSFYPNNQGTLEKIFNRFNIQVEEGDTATEYEPYKEQTVTFPLGEQKLMKDGYLGENGVVNKRKQIVLDGAESWDKDSNSDDGTTDYFYIHPANFNMDLSKTKNFICTHFVYSSNRYLFEGFSATSVFIITIKKSITKIVETDSKNERLTKFKTWLAEQYTNGTPVIVEYELETEETTAYTSTQQTAYNNLQKLKTYRTVTNISNSQDTNMEIAYKNNT